MHILGAFVCLSLLIVIILVVIAKAIVESSSNVKVPPKQFRASVPWPDEIVKKPQAVKPAEPEPSNTLVSPPPSLPEKSAESRLRPQLLNEFIGQMIIKENLQVYLKAALKRRDVLDHVLLTGPAGLGKTSLAYIIANEMGVQLHSTSGAVVKKASDILALLSNLQEGDVLFIDQIHCLLPLLEKKLFPAMKDFSWNS